MSRTILIAVLVTLALPGAVRAECAFSNDVPLRSLTADFAAWRAVTDAAKECGNLEAELVADPRARQRDALVAEPAGANIAGVSNATIVPLLNDGLVRELDDLVEKHGASLTSNQLIRVDGRTVAVAMMVDAQHLMVRDDILKELGLEMPRDWNEVLAATQAIRASGKMAHPLGVAMKEGRDIAQTFVDLHLGFGGQFVNATNEPSVNGEAGMKALAKLKAIAAALGPDHLEDDAAAVQEKLLQGEIAIAQLWASRAGALDDEARSEVAGLVKMSAAPAAVEGGTPATTIWWNGIVLAKNQSDAAAEAAFRVALEGMDAKMVASGTNGGKAVWLIQGYRPGELAQGVAQSAAAGAPAYPSTTAMVLMHEAIGANLAAHLKGETTAEATLQAIEVNYVEAAKDAGIL